MFLILAIFLIISLTAMTFSHIWTDLGVLLMLSETKPWFFKLKVLMDIMALHRREVSLIFIGLVLLLTVIQIFALFEKKKINKICMYIVFPGLLFFALAYPFLSRDIFSYLFSAKIFYLYKQNPYVVIPNAFINQDLWLTFTHWVHRRYVYGPVYLAYSLIPMIIFSSKRFLLDYLGLKLMNYLCFIFSGVILEKITKNKNLVLASWFLNPLLILELLVNSHNDIVVLSLFFLSVYIFDKNKKALGLVVYLLSILTKFVSGALFPIFIVRGWLRKYFINVCFWIFLLYFLVRLPEMQLWYLVWLYFAAPFIKLKKSSWMLFFLFQALLILYKYYSFVLTGIWVTLPQAASLLPFIYISVLLMFINQIWVFKILFFQLRTSKR